MKADVHPRQQDRLKALYSYEILDTDREKEFDEVVALAASICGTTVSVINLIDLERQWFKAEVGLGVRETPLETSLCSHAILEGDFVEIFDTLDDPRMRDNPLCLSNPGLRFYAGAQLLSDDDLPIGTLCVLNDKPMHLTPLQRDAIRVLARQVMNQLNLRRSLATADILRQEVHHRVANSLQSIASLTGIQARGLKNQEIKDALATVQQRITTVASLHEQLYKTDAGDRINLSAFLANIVALMAETAPGNISIKTDADEVFVSSNHAAAIGVVINEFATNSIKHAFPDGQPGTVLLRIKALPGGDARLTCSDDGIGLTEAARGMATGFGLKILEASAAQLGGTLIFGADGPGASVALDFPVLT